jgi:hypothetical protein
VDAADPAGEDSGVGIGEWAWAAIIIIITGMLHFASQAIAQKQ